MSDIIPRVLLVEDDQDVASLYELLLTNEGCEVAVCNDAWQALDWWDDNNGDCSLVILDMDLPGLNGFKLYEKFKEKTVDCPPAMMLSAHGDPNLAKQCQEAGVSIFLDKLKDMGRFIPLAKDLLI